jgi:hypothetical protein
MDLASVDELLATDGVPQTVLLRVFDTRDAVLRPADRKPPSEVTWRAVREARERPARIRRTDCPR